MAQDDGSDDGAYDITPTPPAPEGQRPKPGDPDWVPPVPIVEKAEPVEEEEEPVDPDVETHKGIAVLGYFLFLIPLVAAPKSEYARYHANQGLLLFILWWVAIVGYVVLFFLGKLVEKVLGDIGILAKFLSCLMSVAGLALLIGVLALMVYGIIHAVNGLKKPLPVVGHWNLIK